MSDHHGPVGGALERVLARWPFLRRFADRLSYDEGGCVIWTGKTDPDGYAIFRESGRDVRAHRWAWAKATGEDLHPGLVVRHACDTPGCIRPDHTEAGTALDNIRDRQERGRQARGEGHGRARLTEAQVAAAKRVLAERRLPDALLARLLGVSPSVVRDIKRGRTWRHVAPE